MKLFPEPPVDRPTKMRWGCEWALICLGVIAGSLLLAIFVRSRSGPQLESFILTGKLQAMGVHRALMLYANDHEGHFPEGITNSNEAFRKLFPDYLYVETPFCVGESAWHAAAPRKKPDNDIGLSPGYAQALQRGENHWAYVSGLEQTSDGGIPIIADGFVEGALGTYTDDKTKKGGVWKGTKAIVVLVSGSAKIYPLSPETGFRVWRDDPTTGTQVDLFHLPSPLPGSDGPRILNPE